MKKIFNLFYCVALLLVVNLSNHFASYGIPCQKTQSGGGADLCDGDCLQGQCLYWNGICECVQPCGVNGNQCSGGCTTFGEECYVNRGVNPPGCTCLSPPGCTAIPQGPGPNPPIVCSLVGCKNLNEYCSPDGRGGCTCATPTPTPTPPASGGTLPGGFPPPLPGSGGTQTQTCGSVIRLVPTVQCSNNPACPAGKTCTPPGNLLVDPCTCQ